MIKTANESGSDAMRGGANDHLLRSIFERLGTEEDCIDGAQAAKKDIFAEAKSGGYNVKAIKAVFRRSRMDAEKREAADLLDEEIALYSSAMGIS